MKEVIQKTKNQFELFCPHCDVEYRISINADGIIHEQKCLNCDKNYKYSYGKIKSATGLTGYVTQQCFVRVDINGSEEEFSWMANRTLSLKKGDRVLIVWGKRFFHKDKPKYVLNFTTGIKTLL